MTSTPWGGLVSYRPTTGSTMDDAQALEDAGVPDGSVAWTGYQTAGRGRHPGRRWHAEPGASLLFTVYWNLGRFRVPEFAPSLTVGLGLCRWLESLGLGGPVTLKWPNDVYWSDRKLAGILVRRRLGGDRPSVHAGLGINLVTPAGQGEFRTPPASVREAGRALSPAEALEGLLPFLDQALADSDPRSACEPYLWNRGRALSLVLPDGTVHEGVVRGLDGTGSLLLEGPGGVRAFRSGE